MAKFADKWEPNGTFPIVEDIHIAGGLRVVDDEAALASIPFLRQKAGMLVFAQSEGTWWKLVTPNDGAPVFHEIVMFTNISGSEYAARKSASMDFSVGSNINDFGGERITNFYVRAGGKYLQTMVTDDALEQIIRASGRLRLEVEGQSDYILLRDGGAYFGTEIKHANTKTGYIWVLASELFPNDVMPWGQDLEQVLIIIGGEGAKTGNAVLRGIPSGATITSIEAYGGGSGTLLSATVWARVIKRPFGGAAADRPWLNDNDEAGAVVSFNGNGGGGAWETVALTATAANLIMPDDGNFAVQIRVSVGDPGGADEIDFGAIRITYTYNTVRPQS